MPKTSINTDLHGFLLSFVLVSLLAFPGMADAKLRLPDTTGLTRFTYEELDLPNQETMGLAGGNVLLNLTEHIYSGLGVYGAVRGQRGGFFTGGLETGFHTRVRRNWWVDAGVFVGGGGGGAAPQGGGLMIRPHAGVLYETSLGRFGLNYSLVKFPNGEINSSQWSLSYEHPMEIRVGRSWFSDSHLQSKVDSLLKKKDYPATQDFSVLVQGYQLPRGTLGRSGTVQDENMSLVGIEWDYLVKPRLFFRFQTLGAVGGSSDGYAQVLLGGGYRYDLPGNNRFKIAVSIGASGGGNVDTGGGLIGNASVSLEHRFRNGVLLGAQAGYIDAAKGAFKANTLGLYLGYSDQAPRPLHEITPDDVRARHWRLRVSHQTYFPTGDTRRKGQTQHDDRNIHLIALHTDLILNPRLYLTGQALGAYDGGAGGYAAGLVGGGVIYPLWKQSRLFFNAEGLVGAAGGGGIAVGDGLITQASAGVGYRINKTYDVMLSYGKTQASQGSFEANTLTMSLSVCFTSMAWK